jgi:hypothetical protein
VCDRVHTSIRSRVVVFLKIFVFACPNVHELIDISPSTINGGDEEGRSKSLNHASDVGS